MFRSLNWNIITEGRLVIVTVTDQNSFCSFLCTFRSGSYLWFLRDLQAPGLCGRSFRGHFPHHIPVVFKFFTAELLRQIFFTAVSGVSCHLCSGVESGGVLSVGLIVRLFGDTGQTDTGIHQSFQRIDRSVWKLSVFFCFILCRVFSDNRVNNVTVLVFFWFSFIIQLRSPDRYRNFRCQRPGSLIFDLHDVRHFIEHLPHGVGSALYCPAVVED